MTAENFKNEKDSIGLCERNCIVVFGKLCHENEF